MRRTDEPNAQTQHATILGGSWHQGDFVAWFTLKKLHLNAKLCPRVHRTSSLGLGNLSREQRKFPQVQLRNNFRRCLMSKPVTSQPSWPLKPLRSSKNTAKGQSAPHRAEAGTGHKLDGFFFVFCFFFNTTAGLGRLGETCQPLWKCLQTVFHSCPETKASWHLFHLPLWQCFQRLGVFLWDGLSILSSISEGLRQT